MMEVVVFDLDGTLVDATGLEAWMLAERTDFDVYYEECSKRLPKYEVMDKLEAHQRAGDSIMIVTGRGTEFMQSTLDWMHTHGITYRGIRMRKIGDTRPGHEVKRDIFKQLIEDDSYTITKAYEDDPACADMMKREFGVEVELIPGFPVRKTDDVVIEKSKEYVAQWQKGQNQMLRQLADDYWGGDHSTHGLVDELYREMQRASDKHGIERTPYALVLDDLKKYVVLAEEVGEVARALTYDEGNKNDLKKELLQVAAMASMWYMSLHRDDE